MRITISIQMIPTRMPARVTPQIMLAPSRSLLRYLRQACLHHPHRPNAPNGSIQKTCAAASTYAFSTTTPNRSGHSKWATIKHDKARADAKKNKQRSVLAQQIELMVRCTYTPSPKGIYLHCTWRSTNHQIKAQNLNHFPRLRTPFQR